MPVLRLTLLEGRSQSQLDQMYAEVSSALARTLGCSQSDVRIIVDEKSTDHYAVGGKSMTTKSADK